MAKGMKKSANEKLRDKYGLTNVKSEPVTKKQKEVAVTQSATGGRKSSLQGAAIGTSKPATPKKPAQIKAQDSPLLSAAKRFVSNPVGTVSDAVMKPIDDITERITSPSKKLKQEQNRLTQNQKQANSRQTDVGRLLGGMAVKAADDVVSGVAGLGDMTLGTAARAFGWENNPFSQWNKLAQATQQANREYYSKNTANAGKVVQTVDELGTALVEALPQLAIAYMTAGGSLATEGAGAIAQATGRLAGTEAAQAASKLPGAIKTARAVANNLKSDPQFWTSFADMSGRYYNDAKQDGADDWTATMYALATGIMNAGIESGGGIQKLPGEMKNTEKSLLSLIKSAHEEGTEEPIQGIIERASQNLILGKENPLFSLTDENAVFNPKTAAKEYGTGAAVGFGLGAVPAIRRGIQNSTNQPTPDMIAEVVKDTPDPARAMQNLQAMQTRQAEQNATQATPAASNGIQELETVKQALGKNPTFDDLINYYSQQGESGVEAYQRIAGAFERGELVDCGNSGIYTRAEIEQRQTAMPEEDHIDNRTAADIANTKVNAFQHEHPELHNHFVTVAQKIINEAGESIDRGVTKIPKKYGGGTQTYYGNGIRSVMNQTNLSRQKIIAVCQDIINNHGSENYADAKRVEIALDNLMSGMDEAYSDAEYLQKKGQITGGLDPNSFEYAWKTSWENVAAMENMTEEEAKAQWERDRAFEAEQAQQTKPEPVSANNAQDNTAVSERKSISEDDIWGELRESGKYNGYSYYATRNSIVVTTPDFRVIEAEYSPHRSVRGHVNDGSYISMTQNPVTNAARLIARDINQQNASTPAENTATEQPQSNLPEGQGAMSPAYPYREAQSQTNSTNPIYTAEERENVEGLRPEDRTHKVNSDAEVDRNADERFEFDYEGEKADLFGDKPEWDDADTVLAHKIIEAEIEKARKTGDYSEVVRLQKEYDARGTEQGQALRQRGRFAHSATDIVAEAATLLDEIKGDLPRKMKRAELLEDIKQDADALERARSEGKPVDESNRELIDLIKRLSGKRKTGGFVFGLVMPSKVMKTTSWALEKVAKQEGGNAFLAAVAESQLRSRAADYKPTSPLEVIKTLRYLGMLSKISTIARNLEGNAGFDLVESYSEDTAGQFADVLMSLFTGRRALPFDRSWASKAKRRGSVEAGLRAYLETALDADVSGASGKYETKAGGRTAKSVKSPIARFMSNLEKWSGYMLTVPDEFAKGGTRAEHQRGIDALKAKGKLEADALENSADEAALQRTFQNESRTSNMLSGLRRLADENIAIHDKAGGSYGVGTLITPFAQVPANLGEQFLNYSPLGLIKSTAQVAKVIKNRKSVTPEQQQAAARAFGRGVTGTEFVALAMYLASKGIIHIAGLLDDDDDEKDLSKIRQTEGVTGVQINTSALDRMLRGEDTAWQNGDNLQSIGHLQPLNGQIAMGALLAEDWAENNAITARDIKNANLEAVLETYKDLPSFSSISNIINNYQYSTAEKVGEKMTEAGERFIADSVASFVPNWVSGIAQGMDEGRVRETYTSDREGLAGIVENTANTIQSKIPVAREQLPVALDNFGQERKTTASPFMNWLNSNILPGSITKYQTNAVKQELERLMESGADVSIPNRSPEKKVDTENGEKKLTTSEKRNYQKTYGGETFKGLNELFQSSAYKSLNDDEKAEAEKNVVSFATAKAKQSVGGKAEDPTWATKSDGTMAQNAVYNAQYKTARNTAKQATGKDNPSDGEVLVSLSNRGLDYDTTVKIMAQFMEPNTIKKYETAYADGYDFGLSAAFSGAYYEKSYDFGTTDAGNPKQRGKDNTIAWAQENLGLTRSQAIMLYNYLIKR